MPTPFYPVTYKSAYYHTYFMMTISFDTANAKEKFIAYTEEEKLIYCM